METARRELWRSDDGLITVGLWECAPGRFSTEFENVGEFVRLVSGHLTCVEEDGPMTSLIPGDAMTFAAGWRGEWRIEGALRKIFVGWPGGDTHVAGSSTTRIDGAAAGSMSLEEKNPIAGIDGGSLGTRERISWASTAGGMETGVWECDAGRFHADFSAYGELMQVLNGGVTCTPADGSAPFTLHPGDAAIFPRGWTGEWEMRSPMRKVYALWQAH